MFLPFGFIKAQSLDNNTIVHYSVGLALGNFASAAGKTPKSRIYLGLSAGLVAGVAKEIYDNGQRNHSAQYQDVIATMLGGVTGALLTNFTLRNSRSRKRREKIERCRL